MVRTVSRTRIAAILMVVLALLLLAGATSTRPDEGMWTFDNPPTKLLAEKYGFTPTPEWLEHLRLSSVRFNDGGSGSFVSADGLCITNHHVARGQLQKMSNEQKDYVKDGFYAKTRTEEMKCADLELNALMSMENVTDRIAEAVKKAGSDAEARELRETEMTKISKESSGKTGLRADIVTLYNGGQYWLYRYKKYTDVRLVFAPEAGAAFFGGDTDNFTFPRYDLDMALFRVYENDKPLRLKHFLRWSENGVADGELVLSAGNPGTTERLSTVATLAYLRDVQIPLILKSLRRRTEAMRQYGKRGPEQMRQVTSTIFSYENSIKAYGGGLDGLLDPSIFTKKQKEEKEFRALIAANEVWQKEYGGAWDAVETAKKAQAELFKTSVFRNLRGSRLATNAVRIVRYVAEIRKPDGERLDGYHDAELESFRFSLLSRAPVYPELEEFRLADGFSESMDALGPDDPFVKAVLIGRTPEEAARELISGTKLADPEVRKALIDGGEKAVTESKDPLILAALKLDPMAREIMEQMKDRVESIGAVAGEKIGKARFAVYGTSTYPDATFTLRVSYGTVTGYPMNGTIAPPMTTFYGMYDRYYSLRGNPAFDLPQRFLEGKNNINLATPLNFVSTLDVVGGSSGSPIVNSNGELVGIVFDGNIESLVGSYVYDIVKNRTVAVDVRAMMEALRKLYDANPLADELLKK
ncbi:MAG TPA: S46 family peptidase [Bacteroidota bacterium]|nr:S46 family peptidase [Bacteroidota bacterium]